MLHSVNPATGETVAEYAEMTTVEVNRALRRSADAFRRWSHTPPTGRLAVLQNAAAILRRDAQTLAALITREMGKLLVEAQAEIEKCATACDYYVCNGERILADEHVALGEKQAFVTYRPLGLLLAIMPWNFPFWQSFRAAVPALAVGNTVVLKLASNTTGCALAIAEVFREAGAGEGVFETLRLPGAAMNRVIRHPAVAAVTLTGSTAAGRKVGAVAGGALKKTVLELGGSDPYVVLEDADLDLAARVCAQARLLNCGQSCIAAKRFIVVEKVCDEFTNRLTAAMRTRTPGDPMLKETSLAPMARADLRESLHAQVTRAGAAGAHLVCGGEIPAGAGAFYPPTVLTHVTPESPAFSEELFGPVAAVVGARDEGHAIALANKSEFGLGAAIFTRDRDRGLRIARDELQAGLVAINDLVASDPRVPFGGVRHSGHGRELGNHGPREFANIKTLLNV